MVYPVTGPLTYTERFLGPANIYGYKPVWVYKWKSWYRQKPPYRLHLAHEIDQRRVTVWWGTPYGYLDAENQANPWNQGAQDITSNLAYARFKGQVEAATASLGVSLAERRKSMDMIVKRATQLYRFTKALRRFDWATASRELDCQPPKRSKLRKEAHAFSRNYLEFHMGWSPLVKDIGKAVDVLQGGVPPVKARGRGRHAYTSTDNSSSNGPIHHVSWNTCEISANIRVTNPNLWLANQLGLINPALVAWELVPFSFVVNWFVNVEEFLSSFTDFWGLGLTEPQTTHFQWHKLQYRQDASQIYGNIEMLKKQRSLTLPLGPVPRVRQPWTVSPRRGLAAISLLIQKGLGHDKRGFRTAFTD